MPPYPKINMHADHIEMWKMSYILVWHWLCCEASKFRALDLLLAKLKCGLETRTVQWLFGCCIKYIIYINYWHDIVHIKWKIEQNTTQYLWYNILLLSFYLSSFHLMRCQTGSSWCMRNQGTQILKILNETHSVPLSACLFLTGRAFVWCWERHHYRDSSYRLTHQT